MLKSIIHISSLPFHNPDLLFRQPVQPVHHRIDQLIRLPDPLPQRPQLAHRSLELGPQRLRRLPAGRIDGQLLSVLLEHRQKALVIVLVVALQLCLGREVLHFGPHEALQPAQECGTDELGALEADRATGPRRRDPHDRVAERRLAHSVPPDDRNGLVPHREADVLERPSAAVVGARARRRPGGRGRVCHDVGLTHRGIRGRGRGRGPVWLARISSGVPSTITRPSCIIVTRSATRSAMSMSCSMRISVMSRSSASSRSVSS